MTPSQKLFDSELRKKLKRLLLGCDLDDFVKGIRETHLLELSPLEVFKEAASQLSLVLYQDSYSGTVPYALMVLIDAFQAGKFLEDRKKMFPILQALWYAGQEEKSPPFSLAGGPSCEGKFASEALIKAIEARDFQTTFGMVRAAVNEKETFLRVRDTLYSAALRDIGSLGNKLIYLGKCIEVLEKVSDLEREKILFPALHHLVLGPCDREYFLLLESKLKKLDTDVTQFLKNQGVLSDEEAKRLERILVYQFPGIIIENLVHELKEGIAIDELFQVALTAASHSLLGAFKESRMFPIQGYHFAHQAWQCFKKASTRDIDKIHLVFMAALFVNKMAVESMDAHKKVKFEEVDLSGREVSDQDLEKAIGESQPEMAGAIGLHLLGREDFSPLAQTLTRVAIKNDSGICSGQDIRYGYEVLEDYPRLRIPHRFKLITSLSYFLADLEKDYDLYHALVDSSKL